MNSSSFPGVPMGHENGGSTGDQGQSSSEIVNQKQVGTTDGRSGSYVTVNSEEMNINMGYQNQGAVNLSHDNAQTMLNPMPGQVDYSNVPYNSNVDYQGTSGGDATHGSDMIQNAHRGPPMPSNPSIGGYQLPFTQGMPMSAVNVGTQANILSNNPNYNGMKHTNPHNMPQGDNYSAMQSQGMMPYMSQNGSNTGNPMQPAGQHNIGMQQHNVMMPRQGMMPTGNMNPSHQGQMPNAMGSMGQDMHGNVQAQYMQMPPARPMPMHGMNPQMNTSHMNPGQHNMGMHGYGMNPVQGGGQGQYMMPMQGAGGPQGMMQQGQPMPARGLLPKPWHDVSHGSARSKMIDEIIVLLRSRRPNATPDWQDKLPQMAKRLEDALYHDANTYEEYGDATTLKARLQHLALSMGTAKGSGGKPPGPGMPNMPPGQGQMPPASMQQQQQQNMMRQQNPQGPPQTQQQQQQQHMQMQYGGNPGIVPQQHMGQHGHPQPGMNQNMQGNQQYSQQYNRGQYPNAGYPNMNMPPNGPYGVDYAQQHMNMQQNAQAHLQQYGMQPQGEGNNDAYMRGYPPNQQHPAGGMMPGGNQPGMPPAGPYSSEEQMQQYKQQQQQQMMRQGGNVNQQMMPMNSQGGHMMPQAGMNMMPGQVNAVQSQQMQGQQNVGVQMHPGSQPNAQSGQSVAGGSAHNTDHEHRKQVLKQQQQRLLLLRHASKCPHENGQCPVTPHCWNMKQLWKHIMSCKDQDCKVAHCVSSRYVLSHYSKCKDSNCPVCAPVREAIKRNYERSRDVVRNTQSLTGAENMGYHPMAGQAHQLDNKQAPPAKKARKDAGKKGESNAVVQQAAQQTLIIPNTRAPPKNIYPLDPISCALYTFTSEQITAHFKTIHEGLKLTVSKIREICRPIIDELLRVPHSMAVFGSPVDPVALNLPDYLDIIKAPMDLGTVQKKLENGSYRDFGNITQDVHLTFDNAMLYNPKNSDVYNMAKQLKKDFDSRIRQRTNEFERMVEENRKKQDNCWICGEAALKFEPPVYYCNGTCGQRIRRNAVFYSNPTGNYHWCSSCYSGIRDGEVLRFPDCQFGKHELTKKKHAEEHDEAWVQCESCQCWVHQVCSLFNSRKNVGDEVSFVCPTCLCAKRKADPEKILVMPTTKKMKANDLPVTTLSEFLEKRIYKRLQLAYEETAEKLNISLDNVDKCPPLVLRQVSCLDKLHTVREGVYNRYKDKGYPTDFPVRTKCLLLFQNIDGQDVLLFGMYVYEYGHKCPQPNQRRVYISYLDSVHYLRPKQYRTIVYHEILISYLDYVRARGFHTAHIWACPPQKGDDYIMYVHPADQKTPRPQILRLWYDDMLKRCVERGIVCEITDFHTEYLADPTNDATVLPYFEGDYWVNEAEVIIKNLAEGGRGGGVGEIDDNAGAKNKRKSKSKNTKNTVNNAAAPGTKVERDPVMAKLASIIEPMKDTFFVARLHPKDYAEQRAQQRARELQSEKDKAQGAAGAEGAASGSNGGGADAGLEEEALRGDVGVPQMGDIQKEEAKNAKRGGAASQAVAESKTEEEGEGSQGGGGEAEEEDDFAAAAAFVENNLEGSRGGAGARAEGEETGSMDGNMEEDEGEKSRKDGAGSATEGEGKNTEGEEEGEGVAATREHHPNEPHKSIESAEQMGVTSQAESKEQENADARVSNLASQGALRISVQALIPAGQDLPPSLTDDTEDVDDIQECEHLDSRQSFLNLCQGNHYQFDQLRRAKHTSMMVLYHLHNPDAPKFVPNCNVCHSDILAGCRLHCDRCELDFCGTCYQRGAVVHPHQLRTIAISNQVAQPLTEEQRRERARSVQLHMQLLVHATNCMKCDSRNCMRMKEFLTHEAGCPVKVKGGCRLCIRIHHLFNMHARSCRQDNCAVPHCSETKEQIRRLQLRQQQMDDRRRKKMNNEYSRNPVAPQNEQDD